MAVRILSGSSRKRVANTKKSADAHRSKGWIFLPGIGNLEGLGNNRLRTENSESSAPFYSIAFEAEATRSDADALQAPVRQSRPTTWRAVHRCTRLRACVTYRERLSPRSNRDTPESRLRAKSAAVAQGSSRPVFQPSRG